MKLEMRLLSATIALVTRRPPSFYASTHHHLFHAPGQGLRIRIPNHQNRIHRIMSTITLKSPSIPVTLPEGLSEEKLLAFSPFTTWLRTLQNSLALQRPNAAHPFHADPYALRSITVQSYDLFGPSQAPPEKRHLGFLKLTADVSNGAGETLPGAVFLRGPSVAMLVLLVPEDVPPREKGEAGKGREEREEEERYVVLTVQPRVPAGSLAFVELPAGMVDEGGSFAGTAAREIREELRLEIPAAELRCLSDMAAESSEGTGDADADTDKSGEGEGERLPAAMYPSAGGCDEFIPIYMHERRVPRDTLKEWTGKLTGLRDQGEKITLKLVKMKDLWKEGGRDAKCLAALALWEGLRREGKL
ncbi:hypothetical protein GGR54DRAFT_616949 [Hypoxylon sp. NC1633]|nr:hypothetical protein GGR54DRAFT_616949 [Hypoxylon sp. NC1633]